MNIRNALEKKIENKRQEIVGFQQEITELEARIREANAYILGLQEALKAMPRESNDEKKIEQILRPGSELAKARDFLRQRGKPAHITELLLGIGKENNKNNRASIAGSLGNYARKGEIFTRPLPNTFGLIEFGNEPSVSEEKIENEDSYEDADAKF